MNQCTRDVIKGSHSSRAENFESRSQLHSISQRLGPRQQTFQSQDRENSTIQPKFPGAEFPPSISLPNRNDRKWEKTFQPHTNLRASWISLPIFCGLISETGMERENKKNCKTSPSFLGFYPSMPFSRCRPFSFGSHPVPNATRPSYIRFYTSFRFCVPVFASCWTQNEKSKFHHFDEKACLK